MAPRHYVLFKDMQSSGLEEFTVQMWDQDRQVSLRSKLWDGGMAWQGSNGTTAKTLVSTSHSKFTARPLPPLVTQRYL